MNVPSDMELVLESPERVRLEVRGPAVRIQQVERATPPVVLDLGGLSGPCERTFSITAEQVRLPPGVVLVRAVPAHVHLRLERRMRRVAPVRPQLGEVPAGYRIEWQQVEPAEVTIVGPESRVRRVEFVETDPVELAPTAGEQSVRTHAFLRDPELRLESNGVLTVRVRLARRSEAGEGAVRD